MKEILERCQQIAQIISLLAVPIIVAYFGYAFQNESKEKEINRDFVQMAVSILNSPERKDQEDTHLREWAARMLAKTSPVPFENEEFQALKRSRDIANPWMISDMNKISAAEAVLAYQLSGLQSSAKNNNNAISKAVESALAEERIKRQVRELLKRDQKQGD